MYEFLFWACVLVAASLSAVAFLALADLIQFLIHFPRRFTFFVFRWRHLLLATIAGCTLTFIFLGYQGQFVLPWVTAAFSIAVTGLCFAAFVNSPYLMFRAQHRSAAYVSVQQALEELTDDEEVVVIPGSQDAVAFPYHWINQPHIAGTTVDGDDVVLTWCGLSHLGLGFKSRLPGTAKDKCNLMVLTQLENNLVMFDTSTGEAIQQIYGCLRDSDTQLTRVPTVMMSLAVFGSLYPEGRVFHAPATNLWDRVTRSLMLRSTDHNYDVTRPDFSFPTLDKVDPRCVAKEQVYGVVLDDQPLAFTLSFLKEQGGVLLTQQGCREFTVKWFARYHVVDMFCGHVPDVDIYGRAGETAVQRTPHANRVLWAVWANYYPDTLLDGVAPAESGSRFGTNTSRR